MNTLSDLIGALKSRQSEISLSLAAGNATTWEAYQRMVGTYQGLQDSLDILNNLMEEDNDNE
ncbi:MAG: hypothetical protein ACO3I1_08710 [Burkholderiales bacterium]